MAKRAVFAVLIVISLVYLGDLAVLSVRKDPTSTVMVHPYTTVPRNDKREELIFDAPRDQTCVNSLLPQRQLSPCWYLRRHPQIKTSLAAY